MPVNLPTNLLRSFVAIVDTGSMLNASEQVFVTQSALSLQIKRLEEMLQQTLFLREGRRLNLTPAGELLLDYSRRILQLNDEAIGAVGAGRFKGPARIGMVQDFADNLLRGLLARFAELHPEAQIYARVAGTAELLGMYQARELDIVLGFGKPSDPHAIAVAQMEWYGERSLAERDVIPLAVLEEPCAFREAAIRRLDEAGIRYRITVETPNLGTLKAAVGAGLGITCRTGMFLEHAQGIQHERLPGLPRVAAVLCAQGKLDRATRRLADLTCETVQSLQSVSVHPDIPDELAETSAA